MLFLPMSNVDTSISLAGANAYLEHPSFWLPQVVVVKRRI